MIISLSFFFLEKVRSDNIDIIIKTAYPTIVGTWLCLLTALRQWKRSIGIDIEDRHAHFFHCNQCEHWGYSRIQFYGWLKSIYLTFKDSCNLTYSTLVDLWLCKRLSIVKCHLWEILYWVNYKRGTWLQYAQEANKSQWHTNTICQGWAMEKWLIHPHKLPV